MGQIAGGDTTATICSHLTNTFLTHQWLCTLLLVPDMPLEHTSAGPTSLLLISESEVQERPLALRGPGPDVVLWFPRSETRSYLPSPPVVRAGLCLPGRLTQLGIP